MPLRAVGTRRHKYIRGFSDLPLVFMPGDILWAPAGQEMGEEYYATRRPVEELYDLDADPFERHNLAGAPEHRETLAALRGRVQQWMDESGDRILQGPWPPAEGQMLEPPNW